MKSVKETLLSPKPWVAIVSITQCESNVISGLTRLFKRFFFTLVYVSDGRKYECTAAMINARYVISVASCLCRYDEAWLACRTPYGKDPELYQVKIDQQSEDKTVAVGIKLCWFFVR
jgi:hypothetical protein